VGTSSAFLDLSFGLAPATLGLIAESSGYPSAFLVGGAVALVGAAVIAIRRASLVAPRPTLAT
jgi:hypothetical protein